MARQVLIVAGERSGEAPVKLPDAAIEFWADIYRGNPRIAARGVTFEQFLADPERHLHGMARYHLAPFEQQILRKALARSVRVIDNGRHIEKLRHHRYPRHAGRFMKAKELMQQGSEARERSERAEPKRESEAS